MQIPLKLAPEPRYTFETFIEAPSNQGALTAVKAWPAWPWPAVLLLGPEGSGKTHLGTAWAEMSGGVFIDDAHERSEEALFAQINAALRSDIPGLILASRLPPSEWGIAMPDLRSRLFAMPVMMLDEADEESLSPILRTLFEQRGRVVPPDVIDYLLRHMDRSVAHLRRAVAIIDDAAQSARADVTKSFVAKILRESRPLF